MVKEITALIHVYVDSCASLREILYSISDLDAFSALGRFKDAVVYLQENTEGTRENYLVGDFSPKGVEISQLGSCVVGNWIHDQVALEMSESENGSVSVGFQTKLKGWRIWGNDLEKFDRCYAIMIVSLAVSANSTRTLYGWEVKETKDDIKYTEWELDFPPVNQKA